MSTLESLTSLEDLEKNANTSNYLDLDLNLNLNNNTFKTSIGIKTFIVFVWGLLVYYTFLACTE